MPSLFTYQLFGSSDSQDYDIIIFVNELGTIQENKVTCHYFAQQLSASYSDKPLNINLASIEQARIKNCFKGLPDELNNSLFWTYAYHPQVFPNHIHHRVDRNIPAKILRAIRVIIAPLSRSPYRVRVKKALKANLEKQLAVLKRINFEEVILFQKGHPIDIYKSMAFQTGQTLALLQGVECFSKASVIAFMKTQACDFSPYLNRLETQNFQDLQKGIQLLIHSVSTEFTNLYLYNEKTYDK